MIALGIENNLEVEVARYNLAIAGTEALRASGGGNLRGLDFSVTETPTGVGGPGSPLLNSAASTVTPSTPTVNDLTSLNVLSPTTTNLSVQTPTGYAAGPTVPALQPTLVGQNTFSTGKTALFLQTRLALEHCNLPRASFTSLQRTTHWFRVSVTELNCRWD